jgi:tRNA A-37 threonylcarbamoyl transferase component Bud32
MLADPDLAREGAALVQAAECLEDFVTSVLEQSGIEGIAAAATEPYEEAPPAAADALPDPFPGRYRFRQELGDGTYAKVWRADHLRLDIPVAVKTLHLHHWGKERAQALAGLQNEARILARLEHPNIVRVYELEQRDETYYLVLQYVDGGSLQGRLDKVGPLGWQLAARYVADVAEALQHVHACGIVHRDIKPANILWDRYRDEALLTDFGLAARLANARQAAGTPLFMAPEALQGECTPASDVYGLAATLFALVTGRAPFPAETREELLERIKVGLPDPEPLLAGLPERLENILRAGLAVLPQQRPRLTEFGAALRCTLNRLLADALVLPAGPVELQLIVSRWEGGQQFVPVAGTQPPPRGLTRDLTKVPPDPERVTLRTGDRVRLEVQANRRGYFTVFNVGPAGHVSLLHPTADVLPNAIQANEVLHITDVALTPPAGNERLVAVWSQEALALAQAIELTQAGPANLSRSYHATRNMERVQQSIQQLPREQWHAVVLELDHVSD